MLFLYNACTFVFTHNLLQYCTVGVEQKTKVIAEITVF